MIIIGLCEKAQNYINKNSNFIKGAFIGCKKSDGVIDVKASMYKKETIKEKTVFLFEYKLKEGVCKEEIQKIIDEFIFIRLRKQDGKCISWTKKAMIGILTNGGTD